MSASAGPSSAASSQRAAAVDREGGVEVAAQVVDQAPAPGQARAEGAGRVRGGALVAGHGRVPVADELAGVALEAVDLGRPVGVGNPGDRVEHDVGLARPQQGGAPARDEPAGVGLGAGGERAAERGRRLVVLAEPAGGRLERGGPHVAGGGGGGDHLAEQGVDPQPGLAATGGVDDHAPAHQPAERRRVARPERVRQLGGEPVEDGEADQQVAAGLGLARDHLVGQVVVHDAAGPAQTVERGAATRGLDPGQRLAGEAHRGRPSRGHRVQLGGEAGRVGVSRRRGQRALEHLGRLVGREGEVGGRQLGEQPLAPQPGDGERGVAPRRHDDVQRRRRLAAERGEERHRSGAPSSISTSSSTRTSGRGRASATAAQIRPA